MQRSGVDLPVIMVSGTIGDERAVETMKAGASDYVLKRNLRRLGPAVARELREADGRRARKRADEALELLARTGELLHESLDYDATLARVADLVVPRFADGFSIDLVEEDGEMHPAVTAHVDEHALAIAKELRKGWNARDAPHGPAHVVRTATPELVPDVEAADLARSLDPESRRLLLSLRPRSYVSVPLEVRGRVLGAACFLTSVSGRRYDEHDLEVAVDVGRRIASAVEHARLYREAQRAVRVRDEFMMIASHELRTPLAALVLRLALLRRELEEAGFGSMLAHVDKTARPLRRLTKMVDGVLDVSRITTGRLTLDRAQHDLVEAVRGVVESAQAAASAAGSELRVHAPAHVEGCWDRLRIEQVLTSLIENAIQYGAGRPIDVTIRADDVAARLVVRDRGVGIAPEAVERIFERFERSVAAKHDGGLGLGLFIARQIVEAHGGSIRVESEPRVGSAFTVTLPRSQQPPHGVARSGPEARSSSRAPRGSAAAPTRQRE